jgi:hypothetical protein
MQAINLNASLTIGHAFRYPLQNNLARREVILGGLWLLVPVYGWLINMGHRIMMVHNMQHGRDAWPSWKNYNQLLKHGLLTFVGMVEYHLPAVLVEWLAWYYQLPWLYVVGGMLWIAATIVVPGYMSHYCFNLDSREIFNPVRAYQRVFRAGPAYWKAWGVALLALLISFGGLLLLGVGFLFTSVWFWQVAGFSFATVFSQRYQLEGPHTA